MKLILVASGVLGQLGAAHIHEQDAVVVAVERLVELAHQLAGGLVGGTHHDAIRPQAILDGGALFQKFGVGDHIEGKRLIPLLQDGVDPGGHLVGGAHRHGRLVDDDDGPIAILGDGLGHRQHVAQIGGTIFPRWRAYRQKLHITVFDGQHGVRGEYQGAALDVALQQGFETGFIDGRLAIHQGCHLLFIDIDTDHLMTDVGQYGGLNQAHIATSKYSNVHIDTTKMSEKM